MSITEGDHFYAATADNDMQMQTSTPVLYFNSYYSQSNPASITSYEYSSGTGILDLDPESYPEPYKSGS